MMQISGHSPWALIGRTFKDPAGVARVLVSTRFDRGTLWSALALVTILGVLLIGAIELIAPPPPPDAEMADISPLALTVILGASLVMLVFALHFTGQMLGGTGRFPDALVLMIWFQLMTLVTQVVLSVLVLLLPVLAMVLSLASMGWLLVCLVLFINVMHRFDSVPKAVATLLIAVVGLGVGLSVLLALIGVTVQAGVV